MKIICNKCHKEYFDLEIRKCKCGGIIIPTRGKKNGSYWNEDKVIKAFIRFQEENDHFPTAHEVDNCDYLPAARQIQRRFGGLITFRKKNKLGHDNYTTGVYRSEIVRGLNQKSKEFEENFYKDLIKRFGEPFVHREKPIGNNYKFRYDFFIYTKTGNFGVDIFYPASLRNMASCVNDKLRKHLLLNKATEFHPFLTYLVCLNKELEQDTINTKINNKTIKISDFLKVVNTKIFWERIDKAIESHHLKAYVLR